MTAFSFPTAPKFKTLVLPQTTSHTATLVAKFRATKLAALQNDPKSFFASYAIEAALPFSVWEARFRLCSVVFICIAITDPMLSDLDALLLEEWTGFMSARQLGYDEYYANSDMRQKVPDDPSVEVRWHLLDLYTLPKYRKHGVGKMLMDENMNAVIEISKGLRSEGKARARVRLFVDGRNTWVVDWYKNCGFIESGTANPIDGFTANGWKESIPIESEMSAETRFSWNERFGVALERVVEFRNETEAPTVAWS